MARRSSRGSKDVLKSKMSESSRSKADNEAKSKGTLNLAEALKFSRGLSSNRL